MFIDQHGYLYLFGNLGIYSTIEPVTSTEKLINIIPDYNNLAQNYPNPFNPSTSIQYTINSLQFVSLKVYDVLGKK